MRTGRKRTSKLEVDHTVADAWWARSVRPARFRDCKQRLAIKRVQRFTKVVALCLLAIVGLEKLQLLKRLDSLTNDLQVQPVSHADDGADNRASICALR